MFKIMFAAAILLIGVSGVSAQWHYQAEESAFGTGGVQLAMTGNQNYGFGVRCSGGNIEAVFLTPDDSFDATTVEMANVTVPKLMIRFDQEQVMELDSSIVLNEGKAGVIAAVETDFIEAVGEAKSRVSVALKLLGEIYHENNFNVRGSTKAAGQLMDACPAIKNPS